MDLAFLERRAVGAQEDGAGSRERGEVLGDRGDTRGVSPRHGEAGFGDLGGHLAMDLPRQLAVTDHGLMEDRGLTGYRHGERARPAEFRHRLALT